jgi:hypothetical protein
LWTENSEQGIIFWKKLGDYVKIVEKNRGKIPSKEQLLDARVLPNWKKPKRVMPACRRGDSNPDRDLTRFGQ